MRIFLIVICSIALVLVKAGFYSNDNRIITLTKYNIQNQLTGKNKIWAVEFYTTWCHHCVELAPKWRDLALKVRDWKRYVNIGTFDCTNDKETCKKFKIKFYPTIKFFDASWKKPVDSGLTDEKSWGSSYKGNRRTMKLLRRAIVDKIEEQHGSNFPKTHFDFITKDDIDAIKKNRKNKVTSVKYLALVFEQASSYKGKMLTLDFDGNKEIMVRRVSKSNARLTSDYRVYAFPALILVTIETGEFKELSKDDRTHDGFFSTLKLMNLNSRDAAQAKGHGKIIDELENDL